MTNVAPDKTVVNSSTIQWLVVVSATIVGNCIFAYMNTVQPMSYSHHYVVHTILPQHFVGAFGTIVLAHLVARAMLSIVNTVLRWYTYAIGLLGFLIAILLFTRVYFTNTVLPWNEFLAFTELPTPSDPGHLPNRLQQFIQLMGIR